MGHWSEIIETVILLTVKPALAISEILVQCPTITFGKY